MYPLQLYSIKGCDKNQVEPQTHFEELPETYRCPICKSEKA